MERATDKQEPLMELPIVAFFLALAAGSMDGFTFFSAGTFSTVQSGNVIQIVKLCRDVTAHRRTEEALRAAQQRLRSE